MNIRTETERKRLQDTVENQAAAFTEEFLYQQHFDKLQAVRHNQKNLWNLPGLSHMQRVMHGVRLGWGKNLRKVLKGKQNTLLQSLEKPQGSLTDEEQAFRERFDERYGRQNELIETVSSEEHAAYVRTAGTFDSYTPNPRGLPALNDAQRAEVERILTEQGHALYLNLDPVNQREVDDGLATVEAFLMNLQARGEDTGPVMDRFQTLLRDVLQNPTLAGSFFPGGINDRLDRMGNNVQDLVTTRLTGMGLGLANFSEVTTHLAELIRYYRISGPQLLSLYSSAKYEYRLQQIKNVKTTLLPRIAPVNGLNAGDYRGKPDVEKGDGSRFDYSSGDVKMVRSKDKQTYFVQLKRTTRPVKEAGVNTPGTGGAIETIHIPLEITETGECYLSVRGSRVDFDAADDAAIRDFLNDTSTDSKQEPDALDDSIDLDARVNACPTDFSSTAPNRRGVLDVYAQEIFEDTLSLTRRKSELEVLNHVQKQNVGSVVRTTAYGEKRIRRDLRDIGASLARTTAYVGVGYLAAPLGIAAGAAAYTGLAVGSHTVDALLARDDPRNIPTYLARYLVRMQGRPTGTMDPHVDAMNRSLRSNNKYSSRELLATIHGYPKDRVNDLVHLKEASLGLRQRMEQRRQTGQARYAELNAIIAAATERIQDCLSEGVRTDLQRTLESSSTTPLTNAAIDSALLGINLHERARAIEALDQNGRRLARGQVVRAFQRRTFRSEFFNLPKFQRTLAASLGGFAAGQLISLSVHSLIDSYGSMNLDAIGDAAADSAQWAGNSAVDAMQGFGDLVIDGSQALLDATDDFISQIMGHNYFADAFDGTYEIFAELMDMAMYDHEAMLKVTSVLALMGVGAGLMRVGIKKNAKAEQAFQSTMKGIKTTLLGSKNLVTGKHALVKPSQKDGFLKKSLKLAHPVNAATLLGKKTGGTVQRAYRHAVLRNPPFAAISLPRNA